MSSLNIVFETAVFTIIIIVTIFVSKRGGTCFCPCLLVCFSVCLLARLLKNAFVDFDEMLLVNRCPDHSPDVRTGLLSPISYRLRNFAVLPIGCQRAALLRGILRRENPTYTYWRRATRASRGFKMVLFG